MSRRYCQIDLSERRKIYRLLDQGHSPRRIGEMIGRHTSTIYREVRRNTYDHDDKDCRGYFPVTADELALRRRARLRKLERHGRLRDFIVGKLRSHWSPEQIAGYLRRIDGIDGTGICHETIYRHVYSAEGRDLGLYRYLFRCRKHRRRRYGRIPRSAIIPFANSIHARPPEVSDRREFGHWEGDLMIFERALGNANVTTLVERKSRYTVVLKNDGRRSSDVVVRLGEKLGELPRTARRRWILF